MRNLESSRALIGNVEDIEDVVIGFFEFVEQGLVLGATVFGKQLRECLELLQYFVCGCHPRNLLSPTPAVASQLGGTA